MVEDAEEATLPYPVDGNANKKASSGWQFGKTYTMKNAQILLSNSASKTVLCKSY